MSLKINLILSFNWYCITPCRVNKILVTAGCTVTGQPTLQYHYALSSHLLLFNVYRNSKIFISRDGIFVCTSYKPVDNFNKTQNFILKQLIIYTYFLGIPVYYQNQLQYSNHMHAQDTRYEILVYTVSLVNVC